MSRNQISNRNKNSGKKCPRNKILRNYSFYGSRCDIPSCKDGSFNSFVNLVYDLGFAETLKGVESVTVFAPTDEAFAKAFPDGTFENLTSKQAKDIVSRHIIVGATVKARTDISSGWQTELKNVKIL